LLLAATFAAADAQRHGHGYICSFTPAEIADKVCGTFSPSVTAPAPAFSLPDGCLIFFRSSFEHFRQPDAHRAVDDVAGFFRFRSRTKERR